MADFFHLKTITELHQLFGLEKPLHPLITVIKDWPKINFDINNLKITSDLYLLSMKGNVKGTFKYGRNSYDYEEGTLVFMAPNQVARFDEDTSGTDINLSLIHI